MDLKYLLLNGYPNNEMYGGAGTVVPEPEYKPIPSPSTFNADQLRIISSTISDMIQTFKVKHYALEEEYTTNESEIENEIDKFENDNRKKIELIKKLDIIETYEEKLQNRDRILGLIPIDPSEKENLKQSRTWGELNTKINFFTRKLDQTNLVSDYLSKLKTDTYYLILNKSKFDQAKKYMFDQAKKYMEKSHTTTPTINPLDQQIEKSHTTTPTINPLDQQIETLKIEIEAFKIKKKKFYEDIQIKRDTLESKHSNFLSALVDFQGFLLQVQSEIPVHYSHKPESSPSGTTNPVDLTYAVNLTEDYLQKHIIEEFNKHVEIYKEEYQGINNSSRLDQSRKEALHHDLIQEYAEQLVSHQKSYEQKYSYITNIISMYNISQL